MVQGKNRRRPGRVALGRGGDWQIAIDGCAVRTYCYRLAHAIALFLLSHYADSALYPIIGQMKRAAGFAYNDSLQTKLDKLDGLLARTSTSIQDAALFAEMLSLPNDGRYPTLDLAPQQRRQRTLEALFTQIKGSRGNVRC